jgi:hypothetical protein
MPAVVVMAALLPSPQSGEGMKESKIEYRGTPHLGQQQILSLE